MINTLNTYLNLQFQPLKIPAFTIVEIYNGKVAEDKFLGYFILPIEGLNNKEIKTKIEDKVKEIPGEFKNLEILTCRNTLEEDFTNKRVYAVWYDDQKPTYPIVPRVDEAEKAVAATNPLSSTIVENKGNTCPLILKAEINKTNDESVIFKINDDVFEIDLDKLPYNTTSYLTLDADGFKLSLDNINWVPYNSIQMTGVPKLKPATNTIEVSKMNVTKVDLSWKNNY